MQTIKRIPRITGSTNLATKIRENQGNNNKDLKSLQNLIIEHYTTTGFRITGQRVTLEQLATMLGMTLLQLIRRLNRDGRLAMGNQESAFMGFVSQTLFEALADRTLASEQARLLFDQQEGAYVPFLSGAANQAIANQMMSTRALIELAKTLKPTGPASIINNANQQASLVPGKHISTHEAMKMIEASKGSGLLNDSAKQIALLGPYASGLPEVIATKQQGFKLADEGHIPSNKPKPKHDTRNDTIIKID